MSETVTKTEKKGFFLRKNKELQTEQEKKEKAEEVIKKLNLIGIFCFILFFAFAIKAMCIIDPANISDLIITIISAIMFLIIACLYNITEIHMKTHWILREKINELLILQKNSHEEDNHESL